MDTTDTAIDWLILKSCSDQVWTVATNRNRLTKDAKRNKSSRPKRRVLSLIKRRMVNLAVRTQIATSASDQDTILMTTPPVPKGMFRLHVSVPTLEYMFEA